MAKDTELHFRELLITLDYLFNRTDEDHPATQFEICAYANEKYNINFNKTKSSGNNIRRDRVGNCLKFLYDFFKEHQVKGFTIKSTQESDITVKRPKYYLEKSLNSKNGKYQNLSVENILIALKKDKLTSNMYSKYEDILLNVFANEFTKKDISNNVEIETKDRVFVDENIIKKMELFKKAKREGLPLVLHENLYNEHNHRKENVRINYYVFKITETENDFIVTLVKDKGSNSDIGGVIVGSINNLNYLMELGSKKKTKSEICNLYQKYTEDFKSRDFDENIIINPAETIIVDFAYKVEYFRSIDIACKRFFGRSLECIPCMTYSVSDKSFCDNKFGAFYYESVPSGQMGMYYLVHQKVNKLSFIKFIRSSIDYEKTVWEVINLVDTKESKLNFYMTELYLKRIKNKLNSLNDEDRETFIYEINKMLKINAKRNYVLMEQNIDDIEFTDKNIEKLNDKWERFWPHVMAKVKEDSYYSPHELYENLMVETWPYLYKGWVKNLKSAKKDLMKLIFTLKGLYKEYCAHIHIRNSGKIQTCVDFHIDLIDALLNHDNIEIIDEKTIKVTGEYDEEWVVDTTTFDLSDYFYED